MRGLTLLVLLCEREKFDRHDRSLIGVVEREIRTLLRLRAGDNPDFHLYSRDSKKTWERYERLEAERDAEQKALEEEEKRVALLERLHAGGPEVEAAIESARADMLGKHYKP